MLVSRYMYQKSSTMFFFVFFGRGAHNILARFLKSGKIIFKKDPILPQIYGLKMSSLLAQKALFCLKLLFFPFKGGEGPEGHTPLKNHAVNVMSFQVQYQRIILMQCNQWLLNLTLQVLFLIFNVQDIFHMINRKFKANPMLWKLISNPKFGV